MRRVESRKPVAINIGEAAARAPRRIAGETVKGRSSEEMRAHFQECRDAQPIREACLFCDWSWIGLAGDGRVAAREHREKHHPEAAVRKPRRVSRITRSWERTDEQDEQVSLSAAEANRVRAEKEDADRLEKILRALARDAA